MSASGNSADVIVIGGGIHGCSTAMHCAMRGLSVILIEKDHAGRHASGVNAGGVRQLARHFAEIPLSNTSMALWHNIAELVDDDCGFTSDGQVLVAEDEADLDGCRARVADLTLRGFHHEEMIDARELREIVPAVSETCPGGVISRRDGAAIPLRATAFKRKAESLGATIREGVRVTKVEQDGPNWRVVTDAGAFLAPRIVNAAGAWADRIASDLGEPVPLSVIAPMLMITAPLPAFIKPVVILRGRKLSFKQFGNGTVLIGGGHLERRCAMRTSRCSTGASSRSAPARSGISSRSCAARRSCGPGPVSRPACRTTCRSSARARNTRASTTSSASRPMVSSSAPVPVR